jgi:HD-GYP domain-containing protein (c-di-GMP phosphodiesterase class II)
VMGGMSRQLNSRRSGLEEAVSALEETHSATLKAFSAVVEVHDGPTGEHCERVAENARTLGEALSLNPIELDQLYWAGILHDVGKVAVPASIIQKPGPLSEEEYEQVKRHPAFGANLLRTITDSFEAVARGVESHHERWDGSGYPNGLKAETIPLFGRILAVVDVFEALTSDRPYRDALPPDEALMMLRAGAGTAFEWGLVALYESLFWDGRIAVAGGSRPAVTTEASLTTWLTRRDS